ncbi:MAG TPA: MFS transporter [Steroidobacteraceae bacterium]|nr:MFS transporter [Steroidobacteraceae bacterium]
MTEDARRATRSLAGAILGCATGISALLLYTNGLFVAGLSQDYGLTRTQFGFGVLLVTLALAAANPLVGWAVDRFGPKRPAIVGLLLLALGFASLGAFVHSVRTYLWLQSLAALLGAASGPIAYTKIIGATFDKNRGIALGLTMTGIGLSAAMVPPLLASVIAARGWRAGFFALALISLFGALVVALLVPRSTTVAPPSSNAARTDATSEAGWVRARVFWIMTAAFATMALSFAGLLPHFVPMLTDGGLSPMAAAGIASEIGLAVILSRLVIGFLMDRVFAPRIAIAICLVAAGGFIALMAGGIGAASVTAIALGFAMGAELDLMGFLVTRYFGLAEFGRVYGWLYGAFIFASGLGPLWVGALRDATGTYALSLVISVAGLIATCAGFLLLPAYGAQLGSPANAALTLARERSDFAERQDP